MPSQIVTTLRRARSHALTYAAVGCLMAAAFATPAGAANSSATSAADSFAAQQGPGTTLVAILRGANEVPGPGDPDGSGRATLTLRPALHRVCAHVTWQRLGTPVGAHIHRGRPGVSGNVKVDLTGSVTGGANCARGVKKLLIHRIIAHPRRYYFNIHTKAYPEGAIRGQLHYQAMPSR